MRVQHITLAINLIFSTTCESLYVIPSINQLESGLNNPSRALHHVASRFTRNAVVAFTSRFSYGTNILERDWDVCIILDTCRVDALKAVADEYTFINDVEDILSVGGSSAEWMVHTFDRQWRELLSNTAYLTSNAWAKRIIDDQLDPNEGFGHDDLSRLRHFGDWNLVERDQIGLLEHVWSHVSQEDKVSGQHGVADRLIAGGTLPRYVTDRGIDIVRSRDYDRIILHYTQPHRPYLSNSISESRDPYKYEVKPFAYLRDGSERQTVWKAYLDDLRWVLDDVRIFLENADVDTVVISADHGEAFGEFGIYGHSCGSVHPHVRRVPWVTTSATDTGSYVPTVTPSENAAASARDNLEALGYI